MQNRAYFLTKPLTLEERAIPMPEPGPGEVLIKVGAVGVCGSDLHYYAHGRIGNFVVEYPFILGHECAGTVAGVGRGVTHLKEGDRVAVEPGVPCLNCDFCKRGRYNLCPDVRFLATPPYHGCLCDYIAHDARFVYKLPDGMTLAEGALAEPAAIGVNAVHTAGVKLGDSVAILGAGCIGLVTALAAKAAGASPVVVTDVLDIRLEKARSLGMAAMNAAGGDTVDKVKLLTGVGPDAVIDCAGTRETFRQSLAMAAPGGRIVWVGLASETADGLPVADISVKELTVTSIFRYRNQYPAAIAAIASGTMPVKSLVSNTYHFDESPRAFEEAHNKKDSIVKAVILNEN